MGEHPPVPRAYGYEWALFRDWCDAVELLALPASPTTLAVFLNENPAGTESLRRRVTVINRVHRDAGLAAPGTVTAIRLQLDRLRAARVVERRSDAAPLLAALPTTGWPGAMFGRRDAVILALYAAGLRPGDISALDRRHVTVTTDGGLEIGGRHHLLLPATTDYDAPIRFGSVWRNWEQVLQIVDRHPSVRVLEQCLRTGHFPDSETMPGSPRSGAVVVPINRWGAVPLPPSTMTPSAVAQALTAHLAGAAPQHRAIPARRKSPVHSVGGATYAPAGVDAAVGGRLDDTYAVGVAARRAAHTALADVAEVFDDVEDRADALLQRTIALLDEN